jgi:hypothetical protein
MQLATAILAGTVYKIDFDFTGAEQKAILQLLQQNNFQLLAYKGASGPNQIASGLPTWFARPFTQIFGQVEIDYEPLYKVFVYNKAVIGTNTTIQMQSISDEIGLGNSLIFNMDGSFSPGTVNPPADTIVLQNYSPAGNPNVTVGLAAKVDGVYLPFCAFTSTPQGSIAMTPRETVCMFAAQTALVSGSVIANATAPGCMFSFSAQDMEYDLAVAPSTYALISAGTTPVKAVPSGSNLSLLLN